jgi:hypothetical protein
MVSQLLIYGGAADAAGTQPWKAETRVNVWSTTKGWLALRIRPTITDSKFLKENKV